jgi:hypothetical protein
MEMSKDGLLHLPKSPAMSQFEAKQPGDTVKKLIKEKDIVPREEDEFLDFLRKGSGKRLSFHRKVCFERRRRIILD